MPSCIRFAVWLLLWSSVSFAEVSTSPKGEFQAVFNEHHPLADPTAIANRMNLASDGEFKTGDPYDLALESFQIYVPAAYDPNQPYGLLVWISATDRGDPPRDWLALLDRYRLIWIGPNQCGNNKNIYTQRIPLVLDAVHNLSQRYHLDPRRIYISGISGGGRVASTAALHFPDVFTGGIFVIGVNYWKLTFMPGESGKFWKPSMPPPQPTFLNLEKHQRRYVLLTGDQDMNQPEIYTYYQVGYKRFFDHVLYIQVPELGHTLPPAEWYEKALQYLDADLPDRAPTPAPVSEPEIQTGHLQLQFQNYHPYSSIPAIFKRLGYYPQKRQNADHHYKIEEETFSAFIPGTYDAKTPYGLMVWVHPGDKAGIPDSWYGILEEYKLLWVGANRSGNNEYIDTRRIPLALDAAYNMLQRYNVDMRRVYIAGSSGGGRVSSMIAMHYPDLFSGGIFIIGANYWKDMPVPDQSGKIWFASMPIPKPNFLSLANRYGRYVLLTGDNDSNHLEMQTYYKNGYSKYLKSVLYLQVPEMGHTLPPVEWFEKALIFLDNQR